MNVLDAKTMIAGNKIAKGYALSSNPLAKNKNKAIDGDSKKIMIKKVLDGTIKLKNRDGTPMELGGFAMLPDDEEYDGGFSVGLM
jgi:hypothetical protein